MAAIGSNPNECKTSSPVEQTLTTSHNLIGALEADVEELITRLDSVLATHTDSAEKAAARLQPATSLLQTIDGHNIRIEALSDRVRSAINRLVL